MLHIGLVGIGGIAEKAYLPYMNQLPDIHWHIFTRNSQKREEVAARFGQVTAYDRLEDLLKVNLDGVFIHAATLAHVELASAFLSRGIPVYMDKPVTESYHESKALYDLADQNETFLMSGFNRRFAPYVTELKSLEPKTRIYLEKNDVNKPADKMFKLYDLFIHPLDTALYLADEPLLAGDFHYQITESGLLSQVAVNLYTETSSICASMNLQAGSRREVMEVQSPQATYHLEDLSILDKIIADKQTREQFSPWERMLYKRGFEAAIDEFLKALASKKNPVSPKSSLLSHWICQQIVQSETNYGYLQVVLPDEESLWS